MTPFGCTGYIKPIGTTCVVTGLGWLAYEVHATANTLKTVGRVHIKTSSGRYIHLDDNITKGLIVGQHGYLEVSLGQRRLASWVHQARQWLAWRLLYLAQTGDPHTRPQAVRALAATSQLSDSDIMQLAQATDADTAVALARCRSTRKGFFLPPPALYKTTDKDELIAEMRDVLYKLNQDNGHLCVKYFLSKAFPDYEKQSNYLLDEEVMLTEPWTILTSQDNLLPLCVQALDHHVFTLNNELYLVELGGLPMLMAVHQHLKDNINVSRMICKILTTICSHSELLPQLFESGWVGVLAEWLSSEDLYLSLMAAHCLTNLDRDESSHYGPHVVALHPTHRAHPPLLDVVFVHGLLGGVLSTWRQRYHHEPPITGLQKEEVTAPKDNRERRSSDEDTQEYLSAMSQLSQSQWEQLGEDYEFVVNDFPVRCKDQNCPPYSLNGKDSRVRQYGNDHSYTLCWPKDWLPKDCPSVRVLGIDYESRISEWFPACSQKLRVKTLEERSAVVLEELRRSGIGKRPIVWVAHSMGGLLVKKMLTDALLSCNHKMQRIVHNSRAVVFLSTPHLGCPLANINDILHYLLWPSTEVEELRHNSLVLNKLHKEFHDLLEDVNIRILTFAESKSTRISTLGVDLHIVPPEFSYFDVGDMFEMPCDHACVAKPYNKLSFIYQTVLNLIKEVEDESTPSS